MLAANSSNKKQPMDTIRKKTIEKENDQQMEKVVASTQPMMLYRRSVATKRDCSSIDTHMIAIDDSV